MKIRIGFVMFGFLSLVLLLEGQNAGKAVVQVPPVIEFSNVATGLNGKPLTGMVAVTFYLYEDQRGGSPLWLETQNVQPDKAGHYSVLLGSTTSHGLPTSIFASGEARWLAVQLQGQEEQPRVLLVSTPYALKAADAETIGGLPPSAFVLASPALRVCHRLHRRRPAAAIPPTSAGRVPRTTFRCGPTIRATWATRSCISWELARPPGSAST